MQKLSKKKFEKNFEKFYRGNIEKKFNIFEAPFLHAKLI